MGLASVMRRPPDMDSHAATYKEILEENVRTTGVRLVPDVDWMINRRHDLAYQLAVCRSMMKEGTILPFPFGRAVVLARKSKLLGLEHELCIYVDHWCRKREVEPPPGAKVWISPVLTKIRERLVILNAKAIARE